MMSLKQERGGSSSEMSFFCLNNLRSVIYLLCLSALFSRLTLEKQDEDVFPKGELRGANRSE